MAKGTTSLPLPFGLPSNSMARLGKALDEADKFGAKHGPAFRAAVEKTGRFGSRVASRATPYLFAAAFANFLSSHLHPYGKAQLDARGTGWDPADNCGGTPQFGKYQQSYSYPGSCGIPQVISPQPDFISTGFVKSIQLWQIHPITTYIDGKNWVALPAIKYVQVFGPGVSVRNNIAFAIPMADSSYFPWPLALAPAMAPIQQPRPRELPIPWGALPGVKQNPGVPSAVQIESVYDIPRASDTAPAVESFPNVSIPAIGGVVLPGTGVANPGQTAIPGETGISYPAIPGVVPVAIPTTHFMKPPGPATKEKKFILTPGAANAVVKIFNTLTETEDFIDALYWAVQPEWTGHVVHGRRIMEYDRLKGRKVWWKKNGKWHSRWVNDPSMAAKADYVYRHLGDMDLRKAVANYIKNEIGDRAYGTIGKLGAKAARANDAARSPTISRRTGYSPALPLDPIYDIVDGILGV